MKNFKYLLIFVVSYLVILGISMTVIGLSVAIGDSSQPEPKWVIITFNTLYTICLFPSTLIGRIPFIPFNFDQGYASPLVYAGIVTLSFYFMDKKTIPTK